MSLGRTLRVAGGLLLAVTDVTIGPGAHDRLITHPEAFAAAIAR